jgi:hypothetical protein
MKAHFYMALTGSEQSAMGLIFLPVHVQRSLEAS